MLLLLAVLFVIDIMSWSPLFEVLLLCFCACYRCCHARTSTFFFFCLCLFGVVGVQCLAQDLSRIQRKILRMKVGLGGEKGKNRQEISRVSESRDPLPGRMPLP